MADKTASEKGNLDLYRAQLSAIKELLKTGAADADLEAAKKDLEELINLTEESILASEKARLMEEIDAMVGMSEETRQDDKFDLDAYIGSLCQIAIGSTRSGKISKHAVMMLGFECDVASAKARVMFFHPTEFWMVPCSYFMQGRCNFSSRCKFSHGHLVDINCISEYNEVDRSVLVSGSRCLALSKNYASNAASLESKLWNEGEVISVTPESVVIQFHGASVNCPAIVDSFKHEDVIPLETDVSEEDLEIASISCGSSLSTEPSDISKQDIKSAAPIPSASWEAHTKGIGSKLLAKMGWLGPGSGIGKNAQGRVDPIPVEVLPKGISLDSYSQLKNQSGMVTLGKGAIKMLKNKAAHKMLINEKYAEKEATKKHKISDEGDFFSFLNKSMRSSGDKFAEPSSSKASRIETSSALHNDKAIGVTLLQISQQIKNVERDISKMNETLTRQRSSKPANQPDSKDIERLKKKIADANNELIALRRQEKNVTNQKSADRNRKKLSLF